MALGQRRTTPVSRPPRYQHRRTIYRLRPRLFAQPGPPGVGQRGTVAVGITGKTRHVIFREGTATSSRWSSTFQPPDYDTILDGLRTAVRYDKTYFDKIVASLLPLLEKLTARKISQLLAPDYGDLNDPRPVFPAGSRPFASGRLFMSGWMHCLTQKLPPLSAIPMFADLVSVAGHIYKHGVMDGLPQTEEPGHQPALR